MTGIGHLGVGSMARDLLGFLTHRQRSAVMRRAGDPHTHVDAAAWPGRGRFGYAERLTKGLIVALRIDVSRVPKCEAPGH